jgi:hypothetical protein
VSHFPAAPRFALAVDVNVQGRIGDELGPAVHFIADEIVHCGAGADQIGGAGRKSADRPDVLFELRRDGAFDNVRFPPKADISLAANLASAFDPLLTLGRIRILPYFAERQISGMA